MSKWVEVEFGKIPSDWNYSPIIELKSEDKHAIAMGPFGSNIKTDNFVDSGVPVIRGNNFNYHKYIRGDFVFLTEKKADQLIGSNCKAGDLVFTHRGTIGQVGLIPDWGFPRYVISQSGMKLSVDCKRIDPEFLVYFFLSKYGQYQILKYESQVGVPAISNPLTSLKEIEVPYPSLPEQKAIASVLSSLDDKIDLLHRQNKTLETIAKIFFRQLFVEESQEDWEDSLLGDIADINPTYQLKKREVASYLEMGNVSNTTFNPTEWTERDFSSGMKFQNGDTLLARITPCLENGKTCFVTFLDKNETGWGSTEYIVIRMKQPFHPFISYILARDNDFREFAISTMSGSSGRQRASANAIKEYDLKLPPLPVIEELNNHLAGIVPKLESNSTQIRTLEKLRDTLLPKLMTGKVRVEYEN